MSIHFQETGPARLATPQLPGSPHPVGTDGLEGIYRSIPEPAALFTTEKHANLFSALGRASPCGEQVQSLFQKQQPGLQAWEEVPREEGLTEPRI